MPAAVSARQSEMTVGSLFSGVGGFDLGFERAGFEIRWQVEIEPFHSRVLEKHWPSVHRYGDIRHTHGRDSCPFGLAHCQNCLWPVDVICGGFPCQDISAAGRRKGIDGERSGLWREFARIVGELRPRYVVVENVAALLDRGMGRVLGDLATIGYDAEWECLPAVAFGAPQQRDRVWIVAVDDTQRGRLQGGVFGCAKPPAALAEPRRRARFGRSVGTAWDCEPDVDMLAHGLPVDVARNISSAIGNAIVPQIAEWIAQRIKEAEGHGEA